MGTQLENLGKWRHLPNIDMHAHRVVGLVRAFSIDFHVSRPYNYLRRNFWRVFCRGPLRLGR